MNTLMVSNLKPLYDQLPGPMKKIIRGVFQRIPGTKLNRNYKWIKNSYLKFAKQQRKELLLSISRFANINRPIDGYYFEFGCHSGTTMRLAYECFNNLFDWKYVAFDSFEGLPEIKEIDKMAIWEKGKLSTSEKAFVDLLSKSGMPRDNIITVKGFYEDSLNEETKNSLLPEKAAVVYIDCDLYHSTVPVLEFIVPFLQKGTVIVFDDWNCFHADPNRGERLAFKEFRERYPDLKFEEFVQTSEAKAFIFVG